MKVALTMAAVAAAGMFATGDRQVSTPSQMPTPAGISESVFSTPPPAVVPFGVPMPMPMESDDQAVDTGSCGCGQASAPEGRQSDEDWEIDGCSAGSNDDDANIPPGVPDRVR